MADNTAKPVALYPVWPAAREDVDAVGGKLHPQQIVSVPDEEKIMVGRGLGADDLKAMEFLSTEQTERLIDEKVQTSGGAFLVTPPTISATNSPVAGQTLNLVVSGGKSAFKNDADADIQHHIIVLPGGSEVISVDGTYGYPIPADAGEGAELRFQAIAVDNSPYQNRSDKTKAELVQYVQGNQAPDVSDLEHNFPATVAAGQTGQMIITGGSDPEGGSVTKQLLNMVGITFDVTENIDDTTVLNWQVDAGLSETDFVTLSIVLEDQDGFKSSNINLTANVAIQSQGDISLAEGIAIATSTAREMTLVKEGSTYWAIVANSTAGAQPIAYPISESGVVGTEKTLAVDDMTSTGGYMLTAFTQGSKSHLVMRLSTDSFYSFEMQDGAVLNSTKSNVINGYKSSEVTAFVDSKDRAWVIVGHSNSTNAGVTTKGYSRVYMRETPDDEWITVHASAANYVSNSECSISEVNEKIVLTTHFSSSSDVGIWNESSNQFDMKSGWFLGGNTHRYYNTAFPHPADENKVLFVRGNIWANNLIYVATGDLSDDSWSSQTFDVSSSELSWGQPVTGWATEKGFAIVTHDKKVHEYNAITGTFESEPIATLNPVPADMSVTTEGVHLSDEKFALLVTDPASAGTSYIFLS